MPEFEVVTVEPVHCIAIRERVSNPEIGSRVGAIFGRLMRHANDRHFSLVGPPFVLYHDYDHEVTDMECGYPVGAPVEVEDEIHPCTLPGGEVAKGVHVGPYERLMDTYVAMNLWMSEKGFMPSKMMWERYLTDPMVERDPSKLVTEIFWPIRKE